MSELKPWVPVNVILFGERVLTEVIEFKWALKQVAPAEDSGEVSRLSLPSTCLQELSLGAKTPGKGWQGARWPREDG